MQEAFTGNQMHANYYVEQKRKNIQENRLLSYLFGADVLISRKHVFEKY